MDSRILPSVYLHQCIVIKVSMDLVHLNCIRFFIQDRSHLHALSAKNHFISIRERNHSNAPNEKSLSMARVVCNIIKWPTLGLDPLPVLGVKGLLVTKIRWRHTWGYTQETSPLSVLYAIDLFRNPVTWKYTRENILERSLTTALSVKRLSHVLLV